MTQREKLIRRFLAESPELDLDDVVTLLSMFGYEQRKGTGSHRAFFLRGWPLITFPVASGRKVKRVYIHRIVQVLNLEKLLENS